MADMVTWRTASTRVSTEEPKLLRSGRRLLAPPKHHPDGDLHAYLPGEASTACGMDLSPLKLWPAHRFHAGYSHHRCRRCQTHLAG